MILERPAIPEDRCAIEALVDAAYRHYIERIGTTPGPILDIAEGNYARAIEAGNITLLVERSEAGHDPGDRLAGLLVLKPQADSMLLDNVAVAPAFQGRGIGRRLMQLAERRARALGLDAITLYTQVKMHENREIYRRYGYLEMHRATERGLERVYLRKALT
ncbi:GNAT family N-acetyltransferase [Salinicola rhizosphaerae]|uniref:N-acetyltransferase n=1 Tax=Salinicola rhizosphaerae TaxID=1443141 RepID=A0ABQ3E0G0_9GAMM|nr:GNAT family N-acetyltransferase [Salinicola rhizosphaerae]GHB19434.1 N-acetyltransferase [Salinicola rhizosphaerae]